MGPLNEMLRCCKWDGTSEQAYVICTHLSCKDDQCLLYLRLKQETISWASRPLVLSNIWQGFQTKFAFRHPDGLISPLGCAVSSPAVFIQNSSILFLHTSHTAPTTVVLLCFRAQWDEKSNTCIYVHGYETSPTILQCKQWQRYIFFKENRSVAHNLAFHRRGAMFFCSLRYTLSLGLK